MDQELARSLGIGFSAGLRTFTAPAALAITAQNGSADLHGTPLRFLGRRGTTNTALAFAAAEIAFDKTPWIPSRIKPGPLTGRLVIGALCGATIAHSERKRGALYGALGALAGTLTGYFARTSVTRNTETPDWPLAIFEDVVAVGIAAWIVQQAAQRHSSGWNLQEPGMIHQEAEYAAVD